MQEQRDLLATIEVIQKLELSKKDRARNFCTSLLGRSALLLPLHIIGYWLIQRYIPNSAQELRPVLMGTYTSGFLVSALSARLDSTLPQDQFKPLYRRVLLMPFTFVVHWFLLGVVAWYWQLAMLWLFTPDLSISMRRYPRWREYPDEYDLVELFTGKRKYKLTADQFKLAAPYEPINFEHTPTKRDPAW